MPAPVGAEGRVDYYQATVKPSRTTYERRRAIFDGMGRVLYQVLRERPEIKLALEMRTPEIDICLNALAIAIDHYLTGRFEKRAEVRPYFDRCVDAYIRASADLQTAVRTAMGEHLEALAGEIPALNLELNTPAIQRAVSTLGRTLQAFFAREATERDVIDSFYEMVAVRLEAVEPTEDLTGEKNEGINALEV